MTTLEAALHYRSLGMSVLAVGKDKRPLLSWEKYQRQAATPDEIKQWWKQWPTANVAIITGKVSGLTVVDCDSKEAIQTFEGMLSDTFVTPMQDTPRGGRHYFCSYHPQIRNKAGIVEKIDIRSEGGYVLVAPSSNGNGVPYAWVKDFALGTMPLGSLPDKCISLSLSFSSYARLDSFGESREVNQVKTSQEFLVEGRRDQDLFNVASYMARGRAEPEFIRQVIEILARNCDPPFPERDIPAKVQSALRYKPMKEASVRQEILWWLESKTGQVQVKDWYNESNIVKKEEKHAAIVAFKALCDQGILESCGNRSGTYRKIERDFVVQQWWEGQGDHLPLKFPLDVHELIKVYPGNIILLEGQKSQGKSAYALDFCRMNRKLFEDRGIRYQNVEMADDELKERFASYPEGVMTHEEWKKIQIIKRTSDWWDLIIPDGLNVVDYLIEYKEAYLIADFVFRIHQKLKSGIALVIVQRDPFKPYPAGGRAVRDIPRLVLSLVHHKIKIEDAKSFLKTSYGNPTGLIRPYKQVHWWHFQPQDDWYMEDDPKYQKQQAKQKYRGVIDDPDFIKE